MQKRRLVQSLIVSIIILKGHFAMAYESQCGAAPIPSNGTLKRLAQTVQPNRGMLWRISKNGKSSYLYGTVHVAKLEWDFPGPMIANALKSSDYIAVEVDTTIPGFVEKMNTEGLRIEEINKASNSKVDDEKIISSISKLFKKVCIEENQYSGVSLASKVTALEMFSASDEALYPTYSIDIAIISFAKAINKNVVELETAEEQSIALASDRKTIESDIRSLENGQTKKGLLELTTAWSNGDMSAIEVFYNRENKQEALNRLLTKRNKSLTKAISNMLDNRENAFIAIGILHMAGTNSVVDQLKKLGFFIERLTA